jgi:hypothetical protein
MHSNKLLKFYSVQKHYLILVRSQSIVQPQEDHEQDCVKLSTQFKTAIEPKKILTQEKTNMAKAGVGAPNGH